LIGSFWILESPKYKFGMEDYEGARQIFCKYAQRNGIEGYEPYFFTEEQEVLVELDEVET
jgi:hypothetical protein